MRAEGGVRYACVGAVLGVRGVDGPATGSDARSGGGRTSGISTSSASSDEPDEARARTGNERAAEDVRGVLRGRLDGVSGAKTLSSSETDASEIEKATLRFVLLLVRDGVRCALRRADLVGDADRDCDGVDVGVFDPALVSAFFLRMSLIALIIDSFKSTHSSSIISMRRVKILSDTPNLSTKRI